MDSLPHKVCTKCDLLKPLSDYQKRKSSSDGHAFHCKACQRAYDQRPERRARQNEQFRERYTNAPAFREKVQTKVRRIYATNEGYREATKARAAAWDRENAERVNAHARRRYHAGYKFIERVKKSTERFLRMRSAAYQRRMQDPEKYARSRHSLRLSRHRRRSILQDAGTFTREEWDALCARYGNKCLCCGRDDVPLTVDHVVPVSKGGKNTIHNLQPLCRSCNTRKMTKIIDYR